MDDEKKKRPDQWCGLTPAMIEALKKRINPATGKRYTQSDIARMYGITRQRVSQIKYQTSRFSRTPRERARDIFPFKVPKEPYMKSSPDKRLRDHAEYAITGGDGMSNDKLRRLKWFYERLRRDDTVVVFDLSIPPSPGINTGGYAFVPRHEEDEDYIVRFGEDTNLTEEEKLMWRFPPEIPQV